MKSEDLKKLYTEMISSLLTTMEKSLKIDSTREVKWNISQACINKPSKKSDEFVKLKKTLDNCFFTLNFLTMYMRYNDVRLLEFEMRRFYDIPQPEFINFISCLSSIKTRDNYDLEYFKDLAMKIDLKKIVINKNLILDRCLVILIICNSYKLYDSVSLMAQIIESQLNLFFGKKGVN